MAKSIGAKQAILNSALSVIRQKGYTATTVDDICMAAEVTKGAFFHHFKSKEALAVAAAEYWSVTTGGFFEAAPYHKLNDPLDRLLGYITFRKKILKGELPEFTCLVGTMLQETYETHPAIREACYQSIDEHAALIEQDIIAAMKQYKLKVSWTAKSLALHTQAVIQGAFILAKGKQDSQVAADSIDHLYRYIVSLFPEQTNRKSTR